jgi:hypothetical protein
MSLAGVFTSGISSLGTRFFIVGIIPSTILIFFILSVIWTGAPDNYPNILALEESILNISVNRGLLILALILIVSLILEPFQTSMTRFLEGYWDTWYVGTLFSKIGVRIQKYKYDNTIKELKNLETELTKLGKQFSNVKIQLKNSTDKDNFALGSQLSQLEKDMREKEAPYILGGLRLLTYFPSNPSLFLPTALGNIWRSMEERAGGRYGLETVTAWPRIYPFISENLLAILDDLRNQFDLTVRLCIVFILCTLVSTVSFARFDFWLIIPFATLIMAWLTYRAAMNVSITYGQSVHTAFDLHRFELLEKLRFALPIDISSEKEMNQKISRFLAHGTGDLPPYKVSQEAQTNGEKKRYTSDGKLVEE